MTSRSFVRVNSFRTRLLLNFLFMLIVIVAVTLYTVQSATYSHSTGQLLEHAKTSTRVVKDKFFNRGNALREALVTTSKDFSFKRLIATAKEDPKSLEVALENYQRRSGADIAWVVDKSGTVVAVSESIGRVEIDFDENNHSSNEMHWLRINDAFFMVKAVPIRFVETSQNINGWLFMGLRASQLINADLVELTGMQVSLLQLGVKRIVIGSTAEQAFVNRLTQEPLIVDEALHQLKSDFGSYLYATSAFGQLANRPLHLVLTTFEDKAYLSYNSLIGQLILILFVAAGMSLVAAMFLSKGITQPLTNLMNVANKIRKGEYVSEFPASVTEEVTALSSAISEMQSGIKQREEKIQHLAYFDSLTELPNRNQFLDYLQESIEASAAENIAVMLMDLDRFKDINDTVGHDFGDVLIKDIAKRIRTFTYENIFVARIGGDEFGMIFRKLEGQALHSLAENFTALFERPFLIDQLILDVDVSVGVAMYPTDANSAHGLMQCADIALYSCKGQHYTYAMYRPELNKHSVQRLSLMSELRGALAEGQLTLYYQPKLTLSNSTVATVECLIRWTHPVHGFIPPDDFIPLAEQTGAIRDVTTWVLKTAFKQRQQWSSQGWNIDIAVNISAIDLVDMKLPAYVAELMSEYSANGDSLMLEVTESAVMADPESAMKALNTLRRMGISLSIDDFGTGYSSMAQLKKMPVDELKIDKAFVLDLATNEDDKIMVRTLVSLAQNLGLKTVAEGVEDEQALNFLADIGCTKIQGYYLSRPLPADQFEIWLSEYQLTNSSV